MPSKDTAHGGQAGQTFRYPTFYTDPNYTAPALDAGLKLRRPRELLHRAALHFFTAEKRRYDAAECIELYRLMEDHAAQLLTMTAVAPKRLRDEGLQFHRVSIFHLAADWEGAVSLFNRYGARARAFYRVAGKDAVPHEREVQSWLANFEAAHGKSTPGLLMQLLKMGPLEHGAAIRKIADLAGRNVRRTLLDISVPFFRHKPEVVVGLITEFQDLGGLFSRLCTNEHPEFTDSELTHLRSIREFVQTPEDRKHVAMVFRRTASVPALRQDLPSAVKLMSKFGASAVLLHFGKPGGLNWVVDHRLPAIQQAFVELKAVNAEHELGAVLSAAKWESTEPFLTADTIYLRRAFKAAQAAHVVKNDEPLADHPALVDRITSVPHVEKRRTVNR